MPELFEDTQEDVIELPIGGLDAEYRVVFSLQLPPLQSGDLLHCIARFEVTELKNYNVGVGRTVILATSPHAMEGEIVVPTVMDNVTDNMHHKVVNMSFYHRLTSGGQFCVNLLVRAASSHGQPGDKLRVEPGYGQLQVAVFRN